MHILLYIRIVFIVNAYIGNVYIIIVYIPIHYQSTEHNDCILKGPRGESYKLQPNMHLPHLSLPAT